MGPVQKLLRLTCDSEKMCVKYCFAEWILIDVSRIRLNAKSNRHNEFETKYAATPLDVTAPNNS